MASPFDFAWMLLKAKSEYPRAPFYSSTDRGYEGDPNEGAETFSHLPGNEPLPDEPTPDMEEPAAMAPDKAPAGLSAEEKLQALLTEHPELREMMGGQ
tara:strand:+ start:550 stop:843 length:294 start_codon:yes stop_codon:yes gene_type:complete